MKKIGLMSDTHGHLDEKLFHYFASCDEVWHAGDIGSEELAERLFAFKFLRAVHGNIDCQALRQKFPAQLRFTCERLDVLMVHIGGYPGKYNPAVRPILESSPPGLFICGHSHILKVMPDKKLGLLHINPGACGLEGWHQVKTVVRFEIDSGMIQHLEVIEIGQRGRPDSDTSMSYP
jgi:hypothetical protein